jgi:hypothetical protein
MRSGSVTVSPPSGFPRVNARRRDRHVAEPLERRVERGRVGDPADLGEQRHPRALLLGGQPGARAEHGERAGTGDDGHPDEVVGGGDVVVPHPAHDGERDAQPGDHEHLARPRDQRQREHGDHVHAGEDEVVAERRVDDRDRHLGRDGEGRPDRCASRLHDATVTARLPAWTSSRARGAASSPTG